MAMLTEGEDRHTTIERCALGRSSYLGALYDVRLDSFAQGSLFNVVELPENCVNPKDNNFTHCEYTFENSMSKKFEKLEVDAELSLSILAGLIQLSGSGRYLKDNQSSRKSVKATLIYNIKTRDEKVNVFSTEIKEFLSMDALNVTQATHFVGGISWGANTFASFEYLNVSESKKTEIKGMLKAQLERVATAISGRVQGSYSDLDDELKEHFKLSVYGDVIPEMDECPQDVESAVQLIKRTPTYVKNVNNGKGKAITFQLYPLNEVRKYLSMTMSANSMIQELRESSLIRIQQVFEDLQLARQDMNDLVGDLRSPSSICISRAKIDEVLRFEQNVCISEANLRAQVKDSLVKIRSGTITEDELETVLSLYFATPYSANQIKTFIDHQSCVQMKLQWFQDLLKKGVQYNMENKNESLQSIMIRFDDLYVFFFRNFEEARTEEEWKKNYELLTELLTEKAGDRTGTGRVMFYVCELDQNTRSGRSVIKHYVKGKVVSNDVLAEREEFKSLALVSFGQNAELSVTKPNNRAYLKIRCPKSIYGRCKIDIVTWSCGKCMTPIEYGFDNCMYCSCGRYPALGSFFKCGDSEHGNSFVQFQKKDDLITMLHDLKPRTEVNILIMGETGVGKSTFINAFANYLTFEKLEEAEGNGIISLIPTSFTVTDENYQERQVTIGQDENEGTEEGASKTQSCRGYVFPFGDKVIRLIDTPGIGDTRGIEQDRINFANILAYIAHFPKINGICILLKPNNSRLTVVFRFCIQELLCHLHKSASENIVFLFTNARSTFYRPGDTLPPLRKMLGEIKGRPPHVDITLNQNTIYCLDNESFRFLVSVTNEVRFGEDEQAQYSTSWEKSVKECMRLLEHVCMLKPHKVKDSVSLNEARNLIVGLSRPIGDITQNIQQNLVLLEEQKVKIFEAGTDINKLKEELYVPVIDLEPVTFKEPRTVCASKSCYKLYSIGDIKKIDYVQTCHKPCYLTNVTAEVINNVELKNCAAMNLWGKCKQCKCGWEKHMHVYYENKQVQKQIVDSQKEKELKRKVSVKDQVSQVIQKLTDRKVTLEREQRFIMETSAKFAHFLKHNAITPYNDALADYLDHLISVEESKSLYDTDKKALVKELKASKASYKAQVRILEANMVSAQGLQEISPKDIQECTKLLFDLPENGPTIRKMVTELDRAKNRERVVFSERVYDYSYYNHAAGNGRQQSRGFIARVIRALDSLRF